jgi:hypothetical protein
MKLIDLDPFIGKPVTVTFRRGLKHQYVKYHRGILLEYRAMIMHLQNLNNTKDVWINRPFEDLDRIEIVKK